MDIAREKEQVVVAKVPSSLGREHIVVLMEIDGAHKQGLLKLGVVVQGCCPHENRVGVHIHIVAEGEEVQGIGVCAFFALDNLPVRAPHRGSRVEHGEAVLGVVVQKLGPQDIVLFVAQLHKSSPELGKVLVYQIVQFVAGELRVALDHPHIAEAVDDVFLLAPERSVADKIGAVVQKGRVYCLADNLFTDRNLFDVRGAHKTDQRILLFPAALGFQRGEQGKRRRAAQKECRRQSSFLTF